MQREPTCFAVVVETSEARELESELACVEMQMIASESAVVVDVKS
jgi:hypothetical protein